MNKQTIFLIDIYEKKISEKWKKVLDKNLP